jgi:hypothetical protein
LSEEQASDRVLEILEHGLESSGRFFHVSLAPTPGGDASAAFAPGESPEVAAARLTRDYDLDAWMQADVLFTPEQVRVRLVVTRGPPGATGRLLAREDVYAPADVTERGLHEALLTALGRVSETLGHDGRVTSLREDLVTLDFGRERGLAPGSRVELGLVVLAASHPASGEALRSRKVTTHVVEILDARRGTSVARVVKRNPTVLRRASDLFSGGVNEDLPLLAWRPRPRPALTTQGDAPWETPREVETAPIIGGNDAGFGRHRTSPSPSSEKESEGVRERDDAGFLGELFGSSRQRQRGGAQAHRSQGDNVPERERRADAGESGQPLEDASGNANNDGDDGDYGDELGENEGEGDGSNPSHGDGTRGGSFEEGDDPLKGRPSRRGGEAFGLMAARAGLGMTFGILETDRGDRYTDFPATVLNTALVQADFTLTDGWIAKPEAALRLYSGGDVEGSEVAIKAPVLMAMHQTRAGRLLAGGELHLSSGNVKTIRVKKNLGHLAILGVGEYEAHSSGVGSADVGAGVSVFGLFGGHLEGFLRVGLTPSSVLPAPLSLYARLSSGPEKWSAVDFGALWAFQGGER